MVLCSTIVQLSKQKRTKISRHSRRISVLAFGLCLTHFTWKFFKHCCVYVCCPFVIIASPYWLNVNTVSHSTYIGGLHLNLFTFMFYLGHLNFNLVSSLLPLFATRMATQMIIQIFQCYKSFPYTSKEKGTKDASRFK